VGRVTLPLTPTQQRVSDELLGRGPRPVFPADLAPRLRARLEADLAPLAARVADDSVTVGKRVLHEVHQCERHHLASAAAGFAWTPATARGAVAHKALELGVFMTARPAPAELVEVAIERLREDEWGPAEFLRLASPARLAEVRAGATDVVTKFDDGFPTLKVRWRPRLESSLIAELCGGKIVARGKVDLALGRAEGCTAKVLLVDLKTGRPAAGHADDLRLYALLETLRVGVPPFRVASYYLDSGTWHAEDVTEDVLVAAARRLVDGVAKVVEVRFDGRTPAITPGPACRYCPARDDCEGAREWAARQRDADDHWGDLDTTEDLPEAGDPAASGG
jgi:hypothetical protein